MTLSASGSTAQYFERVSQILAATDLGVCDEVDNVLESARLRGSTIFFVGNGGSASTASHFATDFGVGSLMVDPPFRALSLTDNNAVVTASANDFGYDDIFVRQLQLLAKPDDVLVAISASGNSPNTLLAIEYAKTVQMTSIAFTAFDGGKMSHAADISVHVPTDIGEYGPAEDIHLMLNHALILGLRDRAAS
jgi:D-sedoheptulose 7-phosphate isomerase